MKGFAKIKKLPSIGIGKLCERIQLFAFFKNLTHNTLRVKGHARF
jgi:hypothetical protein